MAGKITPPTRLMLDMPALEAETRAMSAAVLGALVRMKVHLWRTGPLPDDNEVLARITGMDSKDWRKARQTLEPLFIVKCGEWQREDWNDELEAAYGAVQKAKEKSQKGHAARWGRGASGNASSNATGTASGMLNNIGAERSAKTPSPNPKAPSQGEGFSGQPEFLEDVLIAESALGLVGGGV